MPDTKISNLTPLATAVKGDVLPIVNGGATKKITVEDLLRYENVITVAKSGPADYTTIEAALAVAAARDVIMVAPGIYSENNPLTVPDQVTIMALGEQNTTRIEAANANQDLFTSANFFIVTGFSIADVAGTGWIIDVNAADAVIFEDCVVYECEQGFRTSHVSATLTLGNIFFLTLGVTKTDPCVRNNAGNITVAGGRIGVGSLIGCVFNVDGANAITTVLHFLTFETTVDYVVVADNGARSVFTGCSFVGMNDAASLAGGSDTRFVATSVFLAGNDAIRIENSGANTNFVGQGITVESTTRYDLNILSATGTVSGFGQSALDQMNFVTGAQFTASFVDLKEDDEGLNVVGELHVGIPELGAESVMGQGDSYTRGMLVYTYNPAGPVWADVSVAARSASGSTFTFPAVAANNAIYVASSLADASDYLHHDGIKASITTAAVLGGGSIVVEYWNGAAWVPIDHMSTLSNAPYTQYGKNIFERTGSEQIRYPLAFVSSWTKNDPVTPAIGTNYFWMRFRVVGGITTAPIFEQFKLHTDRFEVNADGVTEYFGHARYPQDLRLDYRELSGFSPGNQNVAYGTGVTFVYINNKFVDGKKDGFGVYVTIPTGIDTSLPLRFAWNWYADTANAGDVEFTVEDIQLEVGDLIDGTAGTTTYTTVETVGAGTRYVFRQSYLDLDISDLVPGEAVAIALYRDATAPNDPPDTLNGDVVIFGDIRAIGYFWRP